MTKEKFAQILKEYGYSDQQIGLLWNKRPTDNINEQMLRSAAKHIEPMKDELVQA